MLAHLDIVGLCTRSDSLNIPGWTLVQGPIPLFNGGLGRGQDAQLSEALAAAGLSAPPKALFEIQKAFFPKYLQFAA